MNQQTNNYITSVHTQQHHTWQLDTELMSANAAVSTCLLPAYINMQHLPVPQIYHMLTAVMVCVSTKEGR